MSSYHKLVNGLPAHLKKYVVEQNYEDYTPVDQAVWRYVMRLNTNFLDKTAHKSYLEGLKKTGIGIERIPNIVEMNEVLEKIGWGAVCVDGFIPPSAFMEFQGLNILVIAADIRQLKHIEYTPAPDIIHESAGHAPIIADPEYAEYLRLFGEIGTKAISSNEDNKLYEAVRHLSIIKEDRNSSQEDIKTAEDELNQLLEDVGELSEMAQMRNLQWWTVEYGLIGDLNSPKIYGAGLLSSVGESRTCLENDVLKIPYSKDAAQQRFDITNQQPQLYVTPSFSHLIEVLNEFADGMAYKVGGKYGLKKAIQSNNIATLVLETGLQVSGVFTRMIESDSGAIIYYASKGPSTLSEHNRRLVGHGVNYHKDGFSSPLGKLQDSDSEISLLSLKELREIGIETRREIELTFESGVKVKGFLRLIRKNSEGKNLLFSFDKCTVSYKGEILFDPTWGVYDMAIGEKIVSVFSGAVDKTEFEILTELAVEATPKPVFNNTRKELHKLYLSVRNIREGRKNLEELGGIAEKVISKHLSESLILLEIYEICVEKKYDSNLLEKVKSELEKNRSKSERLNQLISAGMKLIKGLHTADK